MSGTFFRQGGSDPRFYLEKHAASLRRERSGGAMDALVPGGNLAMVPRFISGEPVTPNRMEKNLPPLFPTRTQKRYHSTMPKRHLNIGLMKTDGYLDGQLLIAMPSMTDPRFHRAVIYLCAHSAEGAMGLVINQRAPNISLPRLLEQLEIFSEGASLEEIHVSSMAVHVGGPVETSRGFVLHSADYFAADSTLSINDGVCLTATLDILRAIANGIGPDKAILALGYAGWAPGQLEFEIQANGWLNCPADPDIVFNSDLESKYGRALDSLGIDPSHLVGVAGRA